MSGQQGYPDWQKVSNWDGPLEINKQFIEQQKAFTSGFLYTGNYSNTKVYIPVLGSGVTVVSALEIFWRANPEDETTNAGSLNMGIAKPSEGPNGQFTLSVPNRAPYVQVAMRWPVAGASANGYVLSAMFDNRTLSAPFPATSPELITEVAVKVGAKTQANVYPNYYYAGPIALSLAGPTGEAGVVIEALRPSLGAWEPIWHTEPRGQEGWFVNSPVYVPYSAWRVKFLNASAAERTFAVCAVASPTGS